jgi:hypothetical protein
MALTFNLPSQIVVQTAAQWAADNTVYSNKRILVTSDAYYGSTDQRRFKIADGVQTWSNLDYFPLDVALGLTLAQVLANGNETNQLALNSNSGEAQLNLLNAFASFGWFGTKEGGVLANDDSTIIYHDDLIELNAPSVQKNGTEVATVNDIVAVNTSTIGAAINGASSATPNDTDLVMSVESSVAKKNTWTQVKAFLKTYFDTIYQAAGSYLTSANITSTITNGVTDKAPSEDAVYDALVLKANLTAEVIIVGSSSTNLAQNTTYNLGQSTALSASASSTAARQFMFQTSGTLDSANVVVTQSNSASNEDCVLELRNYTQSTSQTIGNIQYDGGANTNKFFNFVSLGLTVNNSDVYGIRIITAATLATAPTGTIHTIRLKTKT